MSERARSERVAASSRVGGIRRRALYTALYFTEGAPMGYLWWALPTKLRAEGVPVEKITALSALLVVPWSLKVFAAPVLDALMRRRAAWLDVWIVVAQLGMAASFLPLLSISMVDIERLSSVLLLHAVFAALQDVGVDARAVATTPTGERGALNAWMQVGMLSGRALFGGAILLVEARWGTRATVLCLIGAILSSLALLGLSRGDIRALASGRVEDRPSLLSTLADAARTRTLWWGAAFALTGAMAFEAVGAVAGPFLIDRGLSKEEVGAFYGLPVVLATVSGALAGGVISDRIGRRSAVLLAVAVVAFLVLVLAGLDGVGVGARSLRGALVVLFVGIGLFTSSSYALFMHITPAGLSATVFSGLMALTNVCEIWSTRAVGKLVERWGYSWAFCAFAILSLVGLPIASRLTRERRAKGAGVRVQASGTPRDSSCAPGEDRQNPRRREGPPS